jgi:hypothetical protein
MFSSLRQRRRIPHGLPPDLVERLALLHGAPNGIAESTIALLPYGSRSALAAYGLIEPIPERPDQATEIRITGEGWAVIRAAAARARAAREPVLSGSSYAGR